MTDLPVNAQDQIVIQQICDIAAMSPTPMRQMRAAVAAWCVNWEKRVQDAAKPEAQPPAAEKPPGG